MQVTFDIKDTVASAIEYEARKEGVSLDTVIKNLVETTFSPASKKSSSTPKTLLEALGDDDSADFDFELPSRKGEERDIEFP